MIDSKISLLLLLDPNVSNCSWKNLMHMSIWMRQRAYNSTGFTVSGRSLPLAYFYWPDNSNRRHQIYPSMSAVILQRSWHVLLQLLALAKEYWARSRWAAWYFSLQVLQKSLRDRCPVRQITLSWYFSRNSLSLFPWCWRRCVEMIDWMSSLTVEELSLLQLKLD